MNSESFNSQPFTPEQIAQNKFLCCHICGLKAVGIEDTKYVLPSKLNQLEAYICETCPSAFILTYDDYQRVDKQVISVDCLYHVDEIIY